MSTQAVARLQKELKDLMKNPVEGFKVELVNENNLFEWQVYLAGPPGTLYDGGIFKAIMGFPENYPNSPPSMKFTSEFWHPNIYPDGKVCISILHTPDPMNTEEKEEETWRPILTVESILVSVCSMLSDPNFSSPANVDASVELRRNPDEYKKRVRKLVEKSAKDLPPDFEMPKPKKPVIEKEVVFDPFDDDEFEDINDDDEGEDDGEEEVEDEGEEDDEGEEENEDDDS
jgi:ubiquitin-protein ligase